MNRPINPNAEDATWPKRLQQPIQAHVQSDLSPCTTVDSLGVAWSALRLALEAASQAFGFLSLPDEDRRPVDSCEMRSRWCAGIQLLTTAVRIIETDGPEVVKLVRTILAPK